MNWSIHKKSITPTVNCIGYASTICITNLWRDVLPPPISSLLRNKAYSQYKLFLIINVYFKCKFTIYSKLNKIIYFFLMNKNYKYLRTLRIYRIIKNAGLLKKEIKAIGIIGTI